MTKNFSGVTPEELRSLAKELEDFAAVLRESASHVDESNQETIELAITTFRDAIIPRIHGFVSGTRTKAERMKMLANRAGEVVSRPRQKK